MKPIDFDFDEKEREPKRVTKGRKKQRYRKPPTERPPSRGRGLGLRRRVKESKKGKRM